MTFTARLLCCLPLLLAAACREDASGTTAEPDAAVTPPVDVAGDTSQTPPPDVTTDPTQVTDCGTTLEAPEAGATCKVTKGGSTLRIRGDIMTPSGLLHGGDVVVIGDVISCVACSCDAPDATVLSCPDALVTPGLVNPHDHIGWAQLPPIPHGDERYDHRNEWRKGKNGKTKLTSHGNFAGKDGEWWGELRMIMGGATSMMGSGGQDGLVRNLDSSGGLEGAVHATPDTPTFPLGDSDGTMTCAGCGDYKVPNAASEAKNCAYVPHVSEGVNCAAQNEIECFKSLFFDMTAIIHAVGLTTEDIALMAEKGVATIWSPRSNISLYGHTASVTIMKALGVEIALGSDWPASGSINMVRELRCADALNRNNYGGLFTDRELVEMATQNAANVSCFADILGSLAPSRLADIAIFDASTHKGYRAVIDADPADVVLVMRGGKALYGDKSIVDALRSDTTCDAVDVCGREKGACIESEIGKSFEELEAAVKKSSGDPYETYPAYFCGDPEGEPTCVPSRPGEFDGVPKSGDMDGDGVSDASDNCPTVFNAPRPMDDGEQPNADSDADGDMCDPCPFDKDTTSCSTVDVTDTDKDGVPTAEDNCPSVPNPDQKNSDGDLHGDACDDCPDHVDPCPSSVYAVKKGEVKAGSGVALAGLVVTAVRAGNGYYVQHPPETAGYAGAEYSGVFVYHPAGAPLVKPGDRVDLVGVVGSFFGQIQLEKPTLTKGDVPIAVPEPVVASPADLATGGSLATSHEGVLVRVEDVAVTTLAPATTEAPPTNEFAVTGGLIVDDALWLMDPPPAVGDPLSSVTGVLAFLWENTKLEPRGPGDVVLGAAKLKSFGPGLVYIAEGATGSTSPPLMLGLTAPAIDPVTVVIKSADPLSAAPVFEEIVIPVGAQTAEVQLQGLAASPAVTLTAESGAVVLTVTVHVIGKDEAPEVAALEPEVASLLVTKTQTLTVSLTIPAPAGGLTVDLAADPKDLVTLPATVDVLEGQTSATFDVTALDTPGEVTITASTAGGASLSAALTIAAKAAVGLVLAEVLYDPDGGDDGLEFVKLYNGTGGDIDLVGYSLGYGGANYVHGKVALKGTIKAGACFTVGGPQSTAANGLPVYDQSFNFNPDLQNGGSAADGVALFDVGLSALTATTVPIDAVVYGGPNTGKLIDQSGSAVEVTVPKPTKGGSLLRTGAGTWGASAKPNSTPCPEL